MKKLVVVIMLLVLILMVPHAYADDTFVLRNGIEFGDSMADVRRKDKANWSSSQSDKDTLVALNETIAGFSGVELHYDFDEAGGLNQVIWHLNSDIKSMADGYYEQLANALADKYGAPLGNKNGDSYVYAGAALECAATATTVLKYFGGVGEVTDYDEWHIEYGNGNHVKIEIACYYSGISYSDINYTVTVSYNYFDDEELKVIMQENVQKNEAIMNDI